MAAVPRTSPNPAIDIAIEKLMKRLEPERVNGVRTEVPLDMAVKVIQAAIAWEKVKNALDEKGSEFDPDDIV